MSWENRFSVGIILMRILPLLFSIRLRESWKTFHFCCFLFFSNAFLSNTIMRPHEHKLWNLSRGLPSATHNARRIKCHQIKKKVFNFLTKNEVHILYIRSKAICRRYFNFLDQNNQNNHVHHAEYYVMINQVFSLHRLINSAQALYAVHEVR